MQEHGDASLSDTDRIDRDLMELVQHERSETAFEQLMGRYLPAVSRYVEGIVRDGSDADVAQEVFLRIWLRSDQWDGRGEVRAWIFRIATNLALNRLRTIRRRREQPLELPPWEADEESRVPAWMVDAASLGPERVVELAESLRQVRRLVDELPEDKREVMRLVAELGLEPREIAAELGIPEGTVRSRLYYARRRIEREWRDDE